MGIVIDEELVEFKNDWLTVDFMEHFDVRFRISSWNVGLDVQYWQDGQWSDVSHDPNIPFFGLLDHPEDHPVRCFLSTFPEEAIHLTDLYELNRLTLLRFYRMEPPVKDLLEHNPAVLFLFTDWFQTNNVPIAEGRILIKKKQRDILTEVVGHQVPESTVRFLKKFNPSGYNQDEISTLRQAISDEALLTRFRHIKSFDSTTLTVALNNPFLLTCRFFQDAFRNHRDAFNAVMTINDTERMGRQLEIHNHREVIRNCRSIEKLSVLHNRWMERLNEEAREYGENRVSTPFFVGDFPAPPLSGDGNVEPILTAEDLRSEGRAMQHCVGGYAEDVAEGRSYIYRIHQPERGTLQLSISNDKIRLGQLKLERNQSPSTETRKTVQNWLKSHMTGKSSKVTIPDAERAVDLLKTRGYQFSNGSLKELRKELEIFFNNGTMNDKGSILVSPGNPNETWIIFPDDSALVVRQNVIVWRPAPLPPEIMWAKVNYF